MIIFISPHHLTPFFYANSLYCIVFIVCTPIALSPRWQKQLYWCTKNNPGPWCLLLRRKSFLFPPCRCLFNLRPAPGIMLIWFAVLVLNEAAVLLLSTTFRFWLLTLLLLLLTLLLMFNIRVRRPVAKAAKSSALTPLTMGPGGHFELDGLLGLKRKGIARPIPPTSFSLLCLLLLRI